MNKNQIIFIDGDIGKVEKIITQLDEYSFKKQLNYLTIDFPIVFNKYGCSAIHETILINQFLLSILSIKNQYFAPNYFYFIKGSFYKFFLANHQLIYTYLTLKEQLPTYSTIIIDNDIETYRKINNLLNYQTLYLESNQNEINNLVNILEFLRL